jgi:hypothetical protein
VWKGLSTASVAEKAHNLFIDLGIVNNGMVIVLFDLRGFRESLDLVAT